MTYPRRNGETATPTEPGLYWFNGDIDGRRKAELFNVVSTPAMGVMEWNRLAVDSDSVTFRRIDEFVGRWWGPVTPPWEEDK